MRKMTEENLKAAFAGESQAHMKYLNFAEKAKREGKENVARLFMAASFAEQVHASAHLRVLKGVGSTSDNLAAAAAGEQFESEEMYPTYIAGAEAQQERAAKNSFYRALEAEKVHRELYLKAKEAVDAGKDADLGPVYVCKVCGFTTEGELPDECPLCGARAEEFATF
ncbi:MAG: rubrerythrin family protein [Armatimonadota bacterium]|nr:rubrerythrin family protein [Armatimonadota bacterium]